VGVPKKTYWVFLGVRTWVSEPWYKCYSCITSRQSVGDQHRGRVL